MSFWIPASAGMTTTSFPIIEVKKTIKVRDPFKATVQHLAMVVINRVITCRKDLQSLFKILNLHQVIDIFAVLTDVARLRKDTLVFKGDNHFFSPSL